MHAVRCPRALQVATATLESALTTDSKRILECGGEACVVFLMCSSERDSSAEKLDGVLLTRTAPDDGWTGTAEPQQDDLCRLHDYLL